MSSVTDQVLIAFAVFFCDFTLLLAMRKDTRYLSVTFVLCLSSVISSWCGWRLVLQVSVRWLLWQQMTFHSRRGPITLQMLFDPGYVCCTMQGAIYCLTQVHKQSDTAVFLSVKVFMDSTWSKELQWQKYFFLVSHGLCTTHGFCTKRVNNGKL